MKNINSIKTDYKNRFNRNMWLKERRRDLFYYFQSRIIEHGQIGNNPYWFIVPQSSIWLIPNNDPATSAAWYGIAGDHPTDVVRLGHVADEPRQILDHFVTKWLKASERLMAGEDIGDFRIEHAEQRPEIGRLINDRARRMQCWVNNEELWQNGVPTPSEAVKSVSDQELKIE